VLAALLVTALVAGPSAYRIDPAASEAGFDLKATMHTVHGSTNEVHGEVRVEPEGSLALKLSGRIEIGAASIDTGNDKRDATLHGKTLLVASFPTLVLEPERFVPSGPAGADGSMTGTLTGRFTLRGKTKAISIAAALAPKAGRIAASGTFDVRWAEFEIPDPSFFVVRIEDTAHAHFRAEFVWEP
jgi:polyisoprenoid-binding protein YceI